MTHITGRDDSAAIRTFLQLVSDVVQWAREPPAYNSCCCKEFKGEHTSLWELSRGARRGSLWSGCLAPHRDRGREGTQGAWPWSSLCFIFSQDLGTVQMTADSPMEENGDSKITL